MKVLVCGSRRFPDPFRVSLAINERIAALPRGTCVLSGHARGADAMAEEAATRYDHQVLLFPAEWEKHGKKAGVLRNLRMLDEQPDLVIACSTRARSLRPWRRCSRSSP